jgi:hypothetical protein
MRRVAAMVVLIGLLVTASTADAKKLGRYYGGETSQGAPFVLELARGARSVEAAGILVMNTCTASGDVPLIARLEFDVVAPAFAPPGKHVLRPAKLPKSRKFRATGRATEDFGSATAAIVESVSGKVRRNGAATGTYQADITVTDANGATVETCRTGTLKWTARSRRGRVYAGMTSQQMPVVLELSSQRNLVETISFGWGASCTPEGNLVLPDVLSDFRVTGGAFGDVFQQPFDIDGGGKRTFDYDIKGRIAGKTSASGSVAVKMTETDPAGTVTTSCDAGSFTWNARSG